MKVTRQEFDLIKTEAYRLGFCLVGKTPVRRPEHFDLYKEWIDKKMFGEMNYLGRPDSVAKREDPHLLMSGAKSYLVLGYPYTVSDTSSVISVNQGNIAAYARIPDYHLLLKKKMQKLISEIQKILGNKFISEMYVDSSPILEKELAMEAGLGWIGKNGCLISPQYGSFILLSEILTDLEFDGVEPVISDRCGKCSKCLVACPSKCIREDRTLVADRCVSYLTIEHKSLIPLEFRALIGSNVFGCDICQMVCPWNQKIIHGGSNSDMDISDRLPGLIPLEEMIFYSDKEFADKFSKYPISRGKRSRFLRNAAIALGNSKIDNYQVLVNAIEAEHDPLIRAHLYWALGQTRSQKSKDALRLFFSSELDTDALNEIHLALENEPGSWRSPVILTWLVLLWVKVEP